MQKPLPQLMVATKYLGKVWWSRHTMSIPILWQSTVTGLKLVHVTGWATMYLVWGYGTANGQTDCAGSFLIDHGILNQCLVLYNCSTYTVIYTWLPGQWEHICPYLPGEITNHNCIWVATELLRCLLARLFYYLAVKSDLLWLQSLYCRQEF